MNTPTNLLMSIFIGLVYLLAATTAEAAPVDSDSVSAESARSTEPYNLIVILIDSSGSFKNRQAEAVASTVKLLDGLAQTDSKRWESPRDYVWIASIDAIPEVLWHGSLSDLKKQDREAWAKRFNSRSDYAACTDVTSAFELAARYLSGDKRFASHYLFVFSDLKHQPPTTSIKKCQAIGKVSPPPTDFPWEKLQDISVNMFWVGAEEKLLWSRAADMHGLADTFHIHTVSESDAIVVEPPPKAQLSEEVVREQQAELRQEVKDFGSAVLKWSVTIGIIGLLIGVLFWLFRRHRTSRLRANVASGQSSPGPANPAPAGPRVTRIVSRANLPALRGRRL